MMIVGVVSLAVHLEESTEVASILFVQQSIPTWACFLAVAVLCDPVDLTGLVIPCWTVQAVIF